MKKILIPALFVIAATTFAQENQGCTSAPNGQYPENIYVPNCSGNREYITEYGYSGEYSKVQLSAGVNYEFKGSINSDFLTITSEDGSEVLIANTNTVSFTPSEDMIIRFYLHTNENCSSDFDELKARSIKCTSVPTEYCKPVLDCSDGATITNVSINGFEKESVCGTNGYNDFSSDIITVVKESTNQIDVTIGYGWHNQSVTMWIDFNNNFQFEENEFYYLGSGTDQTINGNFTLPAAVEVGEYRMRLRVSAVDQNTATWDKSCDGSQYYGETEDYTLAVVESLSSTENTSKSIQIIPNPATEILNFNSIEDIKEIQLINALGILVYQSKARKSIDINHLPNGLYVVKIVLNSGKTEAIKVIKK